VRREDSTVAKRVELRRVDRGRKPRYQGEGVPFDADGAISEWLIELDGDQALVGQGDVLLGDGRPEHVLEQVGSALVVLGADAGSRVER
jgi:hypothetical protein